MNQTSYQILRSKRKTIAIQITPKGEVIVRCPLGLSNGTVQAFVDSKASWIEKHLQKQEQYQLPSFTDEQIQELTRQAKKVIPQRAEYFAKLLGVDYGRITIRHQRTRWGSCSGKGNLNFNCLLMAVPPEVVDYVVVHELCHRKEMNHSQKFWAEVERILPNYKTYRKWLKDHGNVLIAALK